MKISTDVIPSWEGLGWVIETKIKVTCQLDRGNFPKK